MNCFAPLTTFALIAALATAAHAKPATMKATVLGNPDAPVGGTFYRNFQVEPESFNPLNSVSGYARETVGYVNETLLGMNPDTYEFEPGLAESYEVSKDFLTFTFHLNKAAHFSDGKPVTSADVKFSIDYVKNPAYQAAHLIPYYDAVAEVTAPDEQTVVVRMKTKYYRNLETIGAGSPIFPKHIYEDPKAKFPIAPLFGSGAYKVETYNRGQNLVLVRDKNWWGLANPTWKGSAKFERVNFRFIKDESLQLEMMKKGQIDYLEDVRAESYETRAVGEAFGTTIKKMAVVDRIPKAWGFIGWNYVNPEKPGTPHPILADKDVRAALAMLLNRKLLIEKFMYGKEVEGLGPAEFNSTQLPPDAKPVAFNPQQAKVLLKRAGWDDHDKDGILDKIVNGQKVDFHISLLFANRDVEKYYTIYKEDLRKAGIALELKLVEWSTFTKLLDEQKFDGIAMRWGGGGKESDMKQIWHSESARGGGSNFISYKNTQVDKYIEQARVEMNEKKRMALWQKASRLIIDDHAYTYLFSPKFDLFLVNQRIGFVKPRYTFSSGVGLWWVKK